MGRFDLNPADVEVIRSAARRSDVATAMADFYRELDAAIAAHQPVCANRGKCCRFDEYGHDLYASTLEAAYYLACHEATLLRESRPNPGGCPMQMNNRCITREGRPVGCRVFHCDRNSHFWQGPMTEEALRQLRTLHEQLNVPYLYAEWRSILRLFVKPNR